MRKKIVEIGNSAGVIIDRVSLRLMRLKVGTYVDIETDGTTLLIQRSKFQDEEASDEWTSVELKHLLMRADRVFESLTQSSIPVAVFHAIYHGPPAPPSPTGALPWSTSLRPYCEWLSSQARYTPTPAQIATMRRFEALHTARNGGAAWDDAVRVALEEVPMLREPDSGNALSSSEPVDDGQQDDSRTDNARQDSACRPGEFMAMIWRYLGADDPANDEDADADDAEDDDDAEGDADRDGAADEAYSSSSWRNAK